MTRAGTTDAERRGAIRAAADLERNLSKAAHRLAAGGEEEDEEI